MSETTVGVQGIQLGSVKSERSRERSRSRNSWAVGYEQGSVYMEDVKIKLLGIDSAIDEWLEWRVKWGQRGAGLCSFMGVICYVASQDTIVGLQIATVVFGTIAILFVGVYYKYH